MQMVLKLKKIVDLRRKIRMIRPRYARLWVVSSVGRAADF